MSSRRFWIVCPEANTGPFMTRPAAERWLDRLTKWAAIEVDACHERHEIREGDENGPDAIAV